MYNIRELSNCDNCGGVSDFWVADFDILYIYIYDTLVIMPDIRLKNQVSTGLAGDTELIMQPFDLDFHPTESVLYTGLLTGEVKAFRYDDVTGESSTSWSVRPNKRTARGLSVQQDGASLWTGGKAGGL